MKRILNYSLINLVILTQFVLPVSIFASEIQLEQVAQSKIEAIETLADIKEGKKVDANQTLDNSEKKEDRFVVFVDHKKFEEVKNEIVQEGGVFSIEDDNSYGKVKAVPVDISYMSIAQKNDFIEDINNNSNVVAITPVKERELSAVPAFNDPLYPNDSSYDSSKQWHLSAPANGNLGIDANGAWQYLDSLSKPYGGSSGIVVAVIDTGAAYENYSKYDQFSEMTSPSPWVFSAGSDFTSNIYTNSLESANNQIDDDVNGEPYFCLDKNTNGDCDSGESAQYIDDRNGLNIVDWGRYWSRVTYSEFTSAPVCENEPYLSDGVKCIQSFSNESKCLEEGLDNWEYLGCFESDMGHPNDAHGHGTFVSNIIASRPNNGIGGVGVASGVTLLNIKIFGEYYSEYRDAWIYDSAYGDQIATAINYAVDAGADIVNMSFAGSEFDYYEKLAMDRAYYDEGIVLVASSGNSATSSPYYPAAYESVLSVGASSKTGTRSSYSNYGSTLDLVAPVHTGLITQGMWDTVGNKPLAQSCSWNSQIKCLSFDPTSSPSVFSTFANISSSGTSFAAPQVVAVAALIKTAYPNITSQEIRYILEMSSLPNGSATFSNSIGHGVLNANNAVKAQDYRAVELDKMRRMYQTQLSTSGYLQTRFSDTFGARWSSWITSGNRKSNGFSKILEVPSVSGRVVQIMKGSDNSIYLRYADNFGFIGADDSQWSSWAHYGYTTGSISTTISGNNLIFAWKGTDGKTHTRYSSNGIAWSASGTSSKQNLGSVAMVYDSNSNKVVQMIRSTNGAIFTRSSSDNGATWSSWLQTPDKAASDPTLLYVDGRVIRSVRTIGDAIHTRYSTDGGNSWSSRTRSIGNSGSTTATISLIEIPQENRIIQVYKGKDNNIYTRYSNDNGNSWSTQTIGGGFKGSTKASSSASTAVAHSTIVQNVKGSDGYLYYRRSTNGGISWGGWRNSGSIRVSGNISLSFEPEIDRVYISARGTDGKLYSRVSDNRGETYLPWLVGVSSKSGITTTSLETNEIDLSN